MKSAVVATPDCNKPKMEQFDRKTNTSDKLRLLLTIRIENNSTKIVSSG